MTNHENEAADVAAWRRIRAELELEIDDATQYATIYRRAPGEAEGRPIATAERRRVLDKSSPDWTVYATDGRKIFSLYFGGQDPAARIRKRLAAFLAADQAPAAPADPDKVPVGSWHARREQLEAEGYRLGMDGDCRDLFTADDGRTARIEPVEGPGGFAFTIARRSSLEAKHDRISYLVRRKRELIERRRFLEYPEINDCQDDIDAIAAELLELSGEALDRAAAGVERVGQALELALEEGGREKLEDLAERGVARLRSITIVPARVDPVAANDVALDADELEPVDQAAKDPLDVGAVLYSSWGYEQTNVDFYQVAKLAGDWVTVVKIASVETADGDMTGHVVPADPIQVVGEPMRRKRRGPETIKIESYAFASVWDGKPKRVSHYG